jgi:hypothetical protein
LFIVIEGVDLTGKTTLAQQIQRSIGGSALYVHFSKPNEHPLIEYEQTIIGYNILDKLILDRAHWGETVWPHIFQRESLLDEPAWRHIEMFYMSRGAVMVHAHRDEARIISDLALRDEPLTPAGVKRALELFDLARGDSALPVLDHDFDAAPINEHGLISVAVDKAIEAGRVLKVSPFFIGSPRPRVLLVGEQAKEPEYLLPFVPFKNTSGHFLLDELGPGRAWQRCAIVNALTPFDKEEKLHELWQAMKRPVVVALGKTAAEALYEQEVPYSAVPHPQYVRRFLRKNGQGWYLNEIKDAVADEVLCCTP